MPNSAKNLNILGTVLPEESWIQATLPITLSGLGVRQCKDQYKASYVGSVLSSEDLVSKINGESLNCQVFQDLYSSIAQPDISNLSQKFACHDRGDAISRHDRIRDQIVSACSSANLSPVVEKSLIPESQSPPRDIFVPTWKAGKPAAFDVTVTSSLQSNSLTSAATKAGYALDVSNENFASTTITAQRESHLFRL